MVKPTSGSKSAAKVDEPARLFFAVDLDASMRGLLSAHLSEHAPSGLPGRPVDPAKWHITLRFIGAATSVQAERLSFELADRIDSLAFTVRFGGLGAFPRLRRASVLWLGVDGGARRLGDLAKVCEEAAGAAGFRAEERPFRAHLTLARLRPVVDVGPIVDRVPPFAVAMGVTAVKLFRSRLGRGTARYEVVDRFALGE